MQTKKSLRQELKARLSAQLPEERAFKSLLIQRKLFGLDAFKKAGCVCFFVAMPFEVDTASMIDGALDLGKRVLVPLTDLENKELNLYEIKDRRSDLRPGTMGILEPMPERTRKAAVAEVDCIVVPGLVFDSRHYRIGHGAGFYDRFLKTLAPSVQKIGLGFSFQVLPEVPVEPHDVRLDAVLTD